MLPQAASDFEAERDRISLIAVRSIRAAWRRMSPRSNWETTWRQSVGPRVQQIVTSAQEATAAATVPYVASVLSELDIESGAAGSLNIDAFPGVAGDGRPVESLLFGAVIQAAKAQYSPILAGMSTTQASNRALLLAGSWLERTAEGVLIDTANAASKADTARRPWVTGYVRMVNAGACSRCVILAGKFYLYNVGFRRHPLCKCTHIPASENAAGDLTTNPSRYFDSLSKAEQDRVFTSAGAEAIRMGADMNQVVNARRRMRVAQVYGRDALITTEGVTARGLAGKSLGDLTKVAGKRYRESRIPRLMPETILASATSPEDALRLLKRFGYIL